MAPEQFNGIVTRSTDIYAAGVVLWEAITGRRLFDGTEAQVLAAVLQGSVAPPSEWTRGVSAELDALVLRALDKDSAKRFPTARDMARALERTVAPAPPGDVGEWVERVADNMLNSRADLVSRVENETASTELFPAGAIRELPSSDLVTPLNPGNDANEPATNAQLTSNIVKVSQAPRSLRDHRRVGVVALVTTVAVVSILGLAVRLVATSTRPEPAKDAPPPSALAVETAVAPPIPSVEATASASTSEVRPDEPAQSSAPIAASAEAEVPKPKTKTSPKTSPKPSVKPSPHPNPKPKSGLTFPGGPD
jgi:serine/threonine-protein kinase